MTEDEDQPWTVVTDEMVRLLSVQAELRLEPDRLATVAANLAELRAIADQLRSFDLDGVEPEVAFDPRWTEDPA